jgi:hypothetical protein
LADPALMRRVRAVFLRPPKSYRIAWERRKYSVLPGLASFYAHHDRRQLTAASCPRTRGTPSPSSACDATSRLLSELLGQFDAIHARRTNQIDYVPKACCREVDSANDVVPVGQVCAVGGDLSSCAAELERKARAE